MKGEYKIMLAYVIFYLVIFILSFKIKKDKFSFFDLLLIMITICFSGLRYGIGTDYFLYEDIYEYSKYNISSMTTNRTGFGFSYLCHFFNNLGFSYQTFIFFISVITIICFYYFYKKNTTNPGRSMLLFISLGFYTSSFNGFRQMLSIALLLVSYTFFKNKKKYKSIILALCSFVIHSSSLFGVLLYLLLYKFKKVKINFVVVYLCSVFVSLFYNQLFSRLIVLFDQYSGYLSYDSSPGLGTYLIVLFYLLVTLFILFRKGNKLITNNYDFNFMINILIIGNVIMVFQMKNWLFTRLAIYCTIFVPIILSEYYDHINLKEDKGKSVLFYTIMFFYFIIYTLSFGGVIPYRTIFSI